MKDECLVSGAANQLAIHHNQNTGIYYLKDYQLQGTEADIF